MMMMKMKMQINLIILVRMVLRILIAIFCYSLVCIKYIENFEMFTSLPTNYARFTVTNFVIYEKAAAAP